MTERVMPNPATLVKYDDPVIFDPEEEERNPNSEFKEIILALRGPRDADSGNNGDTGHARPVLELPCPEISLSDTDAARVLTQVLPPRIWEEDGKFWKQSISNAVPTRIDVLNLSEQLSMRLTQRRAKEKGICPVRKELYKQCFDEVIRQVTIDSPERGLMLVRVRDQLRMTIDAYKSLYESSNAYGEAKREGDTIDEESWRGEVAKQQLDTGIAQVMEENDELEKTYQEMKVKMEQIERRHKERTDAAEKLFQEESELLVKLGEQLQAQVDVILAVKLEKEKEKKEKEEKEAREAKEKALIAAREKEEQEAREKEEKEKERLKAKFKPTR